MDGWMDDRQLQGKGKSMGNRDAFRRCQVFITYLYTHLDVSTFLSPLAGLTQVLFN